MCQNPESLLLKQKKYSVNFDNYSQFKPNEAEKEHFVTTEVSEKQQTFEQSSITLVRLQKKIAGAVKKINNSIKSSFTLIKGHVNTERMLEFSRKHMFEVFLWK